MAGFFFLSSSFSLPSADLDNDVLRYTNEFRKAHGLPALVMRTDLNMIARKHSEDMANGRCEFGHSGFDQRFEKIRKFLRSYAAAENVAFGSTTGQGVVEQWKNSSGHRDNLLGTYKYIGIGTASNASGHLYFTQLFVR
jgi:uncharacterized protein YkwD